MHRKLQNIYQRLTEHYPTDGWWPGESAWEVMVGAVLVQRTTWHNAASALGRLKARSALPAARLRAVPRTELEGLIRPSGFFRQKTERLLNLSAWYLDAGGYDNLSMRDTAELRRGLLAIHGIGPETADAILLYAFARSVFVVDAYALRVFSRTGVSAEKNHAALQALVDAAELGGELAYQRFHAAIVEHSKQHCRATPRCAGCVVADNCTFRLARLN